MERCTLIISYGLRSRYPCYNLTTPPPPPSKGHIEERTDQLCGWSMGILLSTSTQFLKSVRYVLSKVHSTYANILKNIYKKVRKIVGIGWIG